MLLSDINYNLYFDYYWCIQPLNLSHRIWGCDACKYSAFSKSLIPVLSNDIILWLIGKRMKNSFISRFTDFFLRQSYVKCRLVWLYPTLYTAITLGVVSSNAAVADTVLRFRLQFGAAVFVLVQNRIAPICQLQELCYWIFLHLYLNGIKIVYYYKAVCKLVLCEKRIGIFRPQSNLGTLIENFLTEKLVCFFQS